MLATMTTWAHPVLSWPTQNALPCLATGIWCRKSPRSSCGLLLVTSVRQTAAIPPKQQRWRTSVMRRFIYYQSHLFHNNTKTVVARHGGSWCVQLSKVQNTAWWNWISCFHLSSACWIPFGMECTLAEFYGGNKRGEGEEKKKHSAPAFAESCVSTCF